MTIPEEKRAGYISLKEASERFGYSQDYIGQLIRKGKIEGKLVYSHVAWVTTPEAMEAYIAHGKDRKKKKKENNVDEVSQIPDPEFGELELPDVMSANDVRDFDATVSSQDAKDEEESGLGKWLIIFFRILVFVVLLVAVFVFYLLTTAFGEEVRDGNYMSASTTFSLSVDKNRHE